MKKSTIKSLTLIALLLSSVSFTTDSFADSYPLTITDVAGRHVTFEHQPQKVALSTGRIFPLLEIIYQHDAATHLVAWRNDMKSSAPSMYRTYIKDYPTLAHTPTIGLIKSGEFDVERFINLKEKPDVFVMDTSNIKTAKDKGLLAKLAQSGIKVIAIDFREHPLKNTIQSVTSLAKALGYDARGQAFADYYQAHLDAITQKLAHVSAKEANKTVFLERAAGYSHSCCRTFSTGNMGAYVPFLKAVNIADKPLHGAVTGQMSPETVIVAQPDVYIMQTTGWVDKNNQATAGIPFGYAPIHSSAIEHATKILMSRPWLKALHSYQTQAMYSIYMPFYNSPYNLVAIEYFAKWIHPAQFPELDPEKTFEQMNAQFAHRTVTGLFGQNNFTWMPQ